MKKYLKKIKQSTKLSNEGAMESRDHFKNGASPKSHTIKRNFILNVKLFLVSLVAAATLSIGLPSCGNNNSQKESSNNEKQKAAIPPKIQEAYEHIKGKTFAATYSAQQGLSVYNSTLTLTFNPINEKTGTVSTKIIQEVNSLVGSSKNNTESKTVNYHIQEDGKIIMAANDYIYFQKSSSGLSSNWKDNNGSTLTFYKR
jgi:hypothetical protein